MKRILQTLYQKWPEYILEVLVLIAGIYGAFTLDNWNEERIQKEELQAIYRIIKADLTTNNEEIREFLEYYETRRKPAFDSILYADLTTEEMIEDPRFRWVFAGFPDLAINTRGYNLLKKISETTCSLTTPHL